MEHVKCSHFCRCNPIQTGRGLFMHRDLGAVRNFSRTYGRLCPINTEWFRKNSPLKTRNLTTNAWLIDLFATQQIGSFRWLIFPSILLAKSTKSAQIAQVNQLFQPLNSIRMYGHDFYEISRMRMRTMYKKMSAKICLNRQSPETTVRRPKVVWKFAQLKSIIASFYVVYVNSSKKIIYPFDISPSLLRYSMVTFIRTTVYKTLQFVQNWSRGWFKERVKGGNLSNIFEYAFTSKRFYTFTSQQFIKVNIFIFTLLFISINRRILLWHQSLRWRQLPKMSQRNLCSLQ